MIKIPEHYNTETKWAIKFFCDPNKKLYSHTLDLINRIEINESTVLKMKELLELSLDINADAHVRMSEVAFWFYMDIYDEINFEQVAEYINELRISEEGDRC